MTPHMGKWYEQGDTGSLSPDIVPADWHEPVPVPFLAVKNAQFVFSIAARHPQNTTHTAELEKIFTALDNALAWLGAGAKTAAGYGYMTEDKNFWQAILDAQTKANLSEEKHLIDELRQESKQATLRSQPVGGTLHQKLTTLINQAATWSTEDKLALFELGTEINKTLWSGNRKVKDRLNPLQG